MTQKSLTFVIAIMLTLMVGVFHAQPVMAESSDNKD